MGYGSIADMSDEEFSDFVKEINAAYWAEEDEMKAGVHPNQVKERAEIVLKELGHKFNTITRMNWDISGPRVKIDVDGKYFGIYNYSSNEFEMISIAQFPCVKKGSD